MLIILGLLLISVGILKMSDQKFIEYPIAKQGVFVILWLIIGLRHNVGIDYPTYEVMYNDPTDMHNLYTEPIWHYVNDTLRFLGFKSRMYFMVTSGFTMLGFYKGLQKLSISFYVSVLLLVLTGIYFETANTVRQCCAVSTLFWGYGYYQEKRYLPSTLLFILAFCCHYSALFGIVLILFANIKIPNIILMLGVLLTVGIGSYIMDILLGRFMPILADMDTYAYSPEEFETGISSGVLKYFYGVLGISCILLQKKIIPTSDKVYQLLNLVVYGICLYSIFSTFQPARRLFMYGFVFIIVLIPYYLKLFHHLSRPIIFGGICLIFLLFLVKANLTVPYDFDLRFI